VASRCGVRIGDGVAARTSSQRLPSQSPDRLADDAVIVVLHDLDDLDVQPRARADAGADTPADRRRVLTGGTS
jgi:hypothetical protein